MCICKGTYHDTKESRDGIILLIDNQAYTPKTLPKNIAAHNATHAPSQQKGPIHSQSIMTITTRTESKLLLSQSNSNSVCEIP